MEQKRVVLLFGSPHAKGATAKLLEVFLQTAESVGNVQISRFDAYRGNYHPCTACGFCQKQEACVFPDLNDFDAELRQADAIVVASPVYGLSFPAPLKAIMDRWQRYYEARFALGIRHSIRKPKTAVLLTAYGSTDADGVAIMQRQLELSFSVMNTTLLEVVAWPDTDHTGSDNLPPHIAEQARRAALAMLGKI